MTVRIRPPRILPVTIIAMASLLAAKSVVLVRAAVPGTSAAPAAASAVPSSAAPTEAAPGRVTPAQATPVQATPVQATPVQAPPVHIQPEPVAAAKATPPVSAETMPAGTMPAGTMQLAAAAEPPVGDTERALLLDLRHRRAAIDAREAELSARENVLAAAQQRLAARVDELQALQARLEALERARQDRDEANWRGLVRTYETMKPRDAAAIFNDLDQPVLLQVLDRMKEAKAGAILAAMVPDRARQATADLAKLRTRTNKLPPLAESGKQDDAMQKPPKNDPARPAAASGG